MATIDKSKSQTYNFLLENKTIEDIKKLANIKIKEKRRHGGKTIKIFNKINREPSWIIVNDDLSENEIFYDAIDDLNNIPTNEISQPPIDIIDEKIKDKLVKYSYNAITIYNENQRKNTGIEKIHEEFLPIADKVFFITTFVHINQSISEKIMYFHHFKNGDNEVIKQLKQYENISKYKDDLSLIEDTAKHNNYQFTSIKDFLKLQQDFKLKPTKIERTLWCIFTAIAVLAGISTFIGVIILFFPTVAVVPTVAIGLKVVGTLSSISFIRIFASLFSSATRKVDVWFGNKLYKNKEQKEKEKKERQSIIKNLTSDKLETKLDTQYDILKQELDNRKDMKLDKLISNNTINNNSNSIIKNSNIESENKNNFDSSIKNTVNHQEQQPSTISKNNWNKVKCLLT